jgi:hypothetical protein
VIGLNCLDLLDMTEIAAEKEKCRSRVATGI